MHSLEGGETADQGLRAAHRGDDELRNGSAAGIQTQPGGISEAAANGARVRRRRTEGDHGDMDRARGETIRREITYSALPSQKRFHNLKTTYKGFSGPIGSGKSQALCQEAIRLSYLNPGR